MKKARNWFGLLGVLSLLLLTGKPVLAGDVSTLSPEQIEARESQIDRKVEARVQRYRAEVEPLLVDLKRNCLKEPGRRCFHDVEILTNAAIYGEPDPLLFDGFKDAFALPSSRKLLDAMGRVAREAEIETKKLEAQRPSAVVRARWNPLADKTNAALRKAADAVNSVAGASGAIRSRTDLVAHIDAIEKNESATAEVSKEPSRELEAILNELRTFRAWAKNFDEFLMEADKGIGTVEQKLAGLRDAQRTDRTALYRYHREFADGLPQRLATLSDCTALGRKVRQAREAAPDSWSWSALSHLYEEWQGQAYDRMMADGLRARLDEAREARHGAEYQGEYERWKKAAAALPAEEVSALRTFWDRGALEPERYVRDRKLIPVLEAVLGERERESATGLVVVNPQQFLDQIDLSQDARTRHLGLLRKFNSNQDLSDLTAMKQTLVEDRTQHPNNWSERLWRKYADLQQNQFKALFSATYADRAMAAEKLHMYRRHDPEPWRKACAAFSEPEVREIVDYLSSGQMKEQRLHAVYSKPFWDDVLAALEQPTSAARETAVSKPKPEPEATPAPEEPAEKKRGGFLNGLLRAPINVLEGAREGLERE